MRAENSRTITNPDEIERYLVVGSAALLHSQTPSKHSSRYKTVMRGWCQNAYIMFDLPSGEDALMGKNQPCVIRFVANGEACGFHGRILFWGNQINPFFRVAWPQRLEIMTVRKHERLELRVPCVVSGPENSEHEGEVRDISTGGLGVCLPKLFPVGTLLSVSFSLPDGGVIEGIGCTVRNAKTDAGGTYHGCQFRGGHETAKADIEFFVSTTLERVGICELSTQRVLFVDQNLDELGVIREVLEKQNIEVIVVSNIVDAFFRLRLASPGVLLVNHNLSPIPGLMVCRIVKDTRGLRSMPVFLYGGNEPGLEQRAAEAHVDRYFPSIVLTEKIVSEILKYVKPRRPAASERSGKGKAASPKSQPAAQADDPPIDAEL